jgi:hypothetical protein
MVSSVNSVASMQYVPQASMQNRGMSSEQQNQVVDILSNYDSQSLTTDDAQHISSSFKELGIAPSRELRNTIESAGFDADAIRDMSSQNISSIDSMQEPLNIKQSSNISGQSFNDLLETLLEEDESTQSSRVGQMLDFMA